MAFHSWVLYIFLKSETFPFIKNSGFQQQVEVEEIALTDETGELWV